MEEKLKNDLLFVCVLIEQLGRTTCNHRSYVVTQMGESMIEHQLEYADINHCLRLEQVVEEVMEDANIESGSFDTVKECVYSVPSVQAIGKVYQRLIWEIREENTTLAASVFQVFRSFISDGISDFNSNLFYNSPSYLRESFRAGCFLPE